MLTRMKGLLKQEDGASLLEYSVLIGILLVLAMASLQGVGTWINSQWTNLNSAVP
jgi:pilus assembly protein Flp/PilA